MTRRPASGPLASALTSGSPASGSDDRAYCVDLRLAAPAIAAWVTAAVTLGTAVEVGFRVGWILGALALLVLLVGRGRLALAGAVCACSAAGALSTALHAQAVRAGPIAELARTEAAATVQLTITGDPEPVVRSAAGATRGRPMVKLAARVRELRSSGRTMRLAVPVLVLAPAAEWAGLVPSQRLTVRARLAPARPGELLAAVVLARAPPTEVTAPSLLQRAAGRVRAGLRRAAGPLPAAERGLLPGLVLGDTSALPTDVTSDFRTTGLTHLVAVSGTNVAIVLVAALAIARRVTGSRRAGTAAAMVALVGFVVVARPSPSVLRAAVMGGIGLLALAPGRRSTALPVLSAAVLGLVLLDPGLARAPGFALSVLATAGIVLIGPALAAAFRRRLPDWLAIALAVPLAAQLACAPLLAAMFGRVSVVAVPANLLAAPAVAPATLLGVGAAAVAPIWLAGAQVIAWCAGVPAAWLVRVAHGGAAIPGGQLGWPSGGSGAVLLALAIAAVAVVAVRRRSRRLLVLGLAVALVTAGAARTAAPGWPPPGWALVVCDVGQGDAIVLSAGAGAGVVVDTGPDAPRIDGCLRRLGVRVVPLVVLTHLHADHIDGLPGVLRGRRVGGIELGPLDEPSYGHARVWRWATAKRVPLLRVVDGSERAVGNLRWRVLAPHRAFTGTESDPNNSSIVLRAQLPGFSALLTGDVEMPAQHVLLRDGPDQLRADVLKVPHHGSGSQLPAFFAAVRARVAVTSAGADNRYGHPAPSTLHRLAAAGVRGYRTDVDGSVAVRAAGGDLVVVARSGAGTPPRRAAVRPAWPSSAAPPRDRGAAGERRAAVLPTRARLAGGDPGRAGGGARVGAPGQGATAVLDVHRCRMPAHGDPRAPPVRS